MVKFLKKFSDMISEKIDSGKTQVKLNTMSQAKMGLDVIYQTCFFALDGFASGLPEKVHREAWKHSIINSIDEKYNKEAKERAKRILSESSKGVSIPDRQWIEAELRPYFEQGLKRDLGKTKDMIEQIDVLKVKENMKIIEKQKKGLYK